MAHSDSRTRRYPVRKHLIGRIGVSAVAVSVAALAFAAPAAAHVRSDGQPVPQGGYGVVRLIVPGETEGLDTVGLTVTLPGGVDLTSARTLPIPGWTANIEREKVGDAERVSRIVWTASDPAAGYGDTEYREFAFSAGPWPEGQDSASLAADQRYSDGSVVAWNEVAVDDASEPEHPAPEVTLVEATDEHSHDGGHDEEAEATASDHHGAASEGTSESSSNWLWHSISVVSLVLAAASAVGVALVVRRGRVTGS